MKILFDDEIFYRQRFGGVSRIFSELIKELQKSSAHQLTFSSGYTENEYLLQLNPSISSFLKPYKFPLKGKLTRAIYGSWAHVRTNTYLRNKNIDVFHPTFYSDYYLNTISKTKTNLVYTIHDLIHELTSNNNHYKKIAAMKERNLKIAKQIIVVSNHTKKDLLKIYPFVNEEIVHVIPLAQSLPTNGAKPKDLPEKYILYTGERSGYKSFISLLNGFSEVHKQHPDIHLYCAGSSSFNKYEIETIDKLQLTHFVHQKGLNDFELRYAYEHALLFAFPSTYEGFGIPLLEAFAAGTPVIAHNATSLMEIGKPAALMTDCTDINSLTNSILSVINDSQLRNSLIKAGIEHEKKFTWKQHVEQTLSVYEKALQ